MGATSSYKGSLMASKHLIIGIAVAVLGLPACSGGPGDRDDLVLALTRDDTFSTAEATCIADAVFSEYGADEEALDLISGADSYDEITGTDGVAGFDEFFTNTVSACSNT